MEKMVYFNKINFKWTEYGHSVNLIGGTRLAKLIEQKRQESLECVEHQLFDDLMTNRSRPYRRGKNRCHRCGLKVGNDAKNVGK